MRIAPVTDLHANLETVKSVDVVVQEGGSIAGPASKGNGLECGPFMSREWLEAFSNRFRKPVFFRFIHDGQEAGFAAGLIVKPAAPFHIPVKFPKIHLFAGPVVVGKDPRTIQSCLLSLKRFARKGNYWDIYLDSLDYPDDFDIGNIGYMPRIRDEYIIDLRDDIDKIHGRIQKSKRKDLRRADKDHLSVKEITGPGKFVHLVSCLESTREKKKKIGLGNYPSYYVSYLDDEILNRLLESSIAKLYCIYRDDKILSSILLLVHGKKSYALLGGTREAGYELNANTALHWEVMKKMKESGIEYLNLGRIPRDDSEPGLIQFKTGMGAVRHICTGGVADDIQGAPGKILMYLYRKTHKYQDWLSNE